MDSPDHAQLCVIILTGGGSSRMGVDKAVQLWGDERAVDRVAQLAKSLGARRIVTAGDGDYGFERAPDPKAQSGPVAGVLMGLAALRREPGRILVLAVDAPTLTTADVEPLLKAAGPGAAFAGLPLPMVIDPAAVPAEAQFDWPLRRLVDRAGLTRVSLDPSAMDRIRGANTPQEMARLLREAGGS
jgi:molybdenum cofactor guanylyltransferase